MITERVDDIPLLLAELEKSNLSNILSAHFPDHGNWQGADGGMVTALFLTYILSCADHRTSHVETWASERIHTLRLCTGRPNLSAKDLTDDRLGILLDKYSDTAAWHKFETAHNKNLIQVYNLDIAKEPIRLDGMITQSHREQGGDFQRGYSKQHRADLPQMKTMLAAVDPYAIPLVSLTVAGNEADDGLYLPVIEQLDATLSLKHQLFVADSKLSSIENRSGIVCLGHYYLTPLSKKQCSTEQLDRYLSQLATQPNLLKTLHTQDKDKQLIIKAKAFESSETISHIIENKVPKELKKILTWEERRIIVYSPSYAQSQIKTFDKRLNRAKAALNILFQPQQGRKRPKTYQETKQAVNKILKQHRVTSIIDVKIIETTWEKEVRAYLDRPAETRTITDLSIEYSINEAEQQKQLGRMGWRVFASNAPKEKLNTLDAVQCYRNEYRIEHKFDERLNRVTASMPVYLNKPNRIKALIRLLLIALKYVSLIQMQVRQKLENTKQTLKELYPGNPGRKTDKPTNKMLLKAFEYITLVIIPIENQTIIKLTQLKPIQLQILSLLDLSPIIYHKLNQMSFYDLDLGET